MPFHALDIPCKTAAGHAALLSDTQGLTPSQQAILRLVDGRRSMDEVLRLSGHGSNGRHNLTALSDQGLLVHAAGVCLPGETPTAIAAPQRARRLLMQTLLYRTPLTGAWTMLRLRRVHDIDGLRKLLPAVRTCLSMAHVDECDRLLHEVEGLLTPH